MITSLYRLVGARDIRRQSEADEYLRRLWAARVKFNEWRRATTITFGRKSYVRL